MIARWLLLSVAVVVFSPNLVRAQGNITSTFTVFPDHAKMYEDVEIFRRILDRKLDPLYPRYSFQGLSKSVAPAYALNQGQLFTIYRATGAVNPGWLTSTAITGGLPRSISISVSLSSPPTTLRTLFSMSSLPRKRSVIPWRAFT